MSRRCESETCGSVECGERCLEFIDEDMSGR